MDWSKRTAERMLQNINKRLQMLAMEQQSMNGNRGGGTMSKGGRVKMQVRGVVPGKKGPDWYNGAGLNFNKQPGSYMNSYDPNMRINPNMNFDPNRMGNFGNPLYPDLNFNNPTQPTTPTRSNPYSNTGSPTFNMATDQNFGSFTNVPEQYDLPTQQASKQYAYNFYGNGSTPTSPTTAVKPVLPTTPVAVSDANLAKLEAAKKAVTAPHNNNLGFLNEGVSKLNLQTGKYGTSIGTRNPVDNTLAGAPNVRTSPPTGNSKFNFNNLMGLAPSIFNAVAGLTSGKEDNLNPNEFQNPYEDQAFSMMPDQFRVDDMLNDNRNSYATYLRNVNQTGNSRGERMANYGAGINRMNEANTRAWALKNNQEAAMNTNRAQMRNDQGARRAGINLQVRDMNDANAAASRNRRMGYLSAAASGAQTYGLTQQQMANQNTSQDAMIEAMRRMGPYWSQWLGLDKMKRNG